MPTALFLSPHLDDVAFSCAGTLLRLLAVGWDVRLVTVFTASVPDPRGFALRCQTDKGIAPEADYMALRRAEDRDFAGIAGLVSAPKCWEWREAPHRGYDAPAALFAGRRAEDEVWREIAGALRALADTLNPALVFAPQGLGNHVDHLQTILAVREAGLDARTGWYRDTPYAIREPAAPPSPLLPAGLSARAAPFGADVLARKIDGCMAYRSQVPFQFGGVAAAARKLTDFHRQEAIAAGLPEYAERFLAAPSLPFPNFS